MATHIRDVHQSKICYRKTSNIEGCRREKSVAGRCEKPKYDGKSTKRKGKGIDQPKAKYSY